MFPTCLKRNPSTPFTEIHHLLATLFHLSLSFIYLSFTLSLYLLSSLVSTSLFSLLLFPSLSPPFHPQRDTLLVMLMRQFTEATGGRRIVPQRIWAPKLRAFACAAGADAGTVLDCA
jgi:hypothetical protein